MSACNVTHREADLLSSSPPPVSKQGTTVYGSIRFTHKDHVVVGMTENAAAHTPLFTRLWTPDP